MWTVIYIAPNDDMAEKCKEVLTCEGVLVQLRSVSVAQCSGHCSVEILVPELEVEEAHQILTNYMGQ
ncbi:MAG: glutamate decarboxylase [Peptococcaceae bacterium]|nr:glutamate decarboxylase [Peptococcaceae bacterium]